MADDVDTVTSTDAAEKKVRKPKRVAKSEKKGKKAKKPGPRPGLSSESNYPRHTLERALRIPRGILEQNAGKPCTENEAAKFAGISLHGQTKSEIASSIKYGLLKREADNLILTDLVRRILRPQTSSAEVDGLQAAVQEAPVFKDVYSHYRGENLPDDQFLQNMLIEKHHLPSDKVPEFLEIFLSSLRYSKLLDESGGKRRLLDETHGATRPNDNTSTLARLVKKADVKEGDACFVMMPFANPIGGYYASIYEPAIIKAGLKPMRADADIFGPGKIIDQIYRGISDAKVLIAELTSKNPNVFYELGLAHAMQKPVVLVSATEDDNPFDTKHLRVIFYDIKDPFWGQKLIDKVSESILSTLANPEEALFKSLLKDA